MFIDNSQFYNSHGKERKKNCYPQPSLPSSKKKIIFLLDYNSFLLLICLKIAYGNSIRINSVNGCCGRLVTILFDFTDWEKYGQNSNDQIMIKIAKMIQLLSPGIQIKKWFKLDSPFFFLSVKEQTMKS